MMARCLKLVVLATLICVLSSVEGAASVIGYWRFEDSSTLGIDSSGNGRTMTVAGSPASLAFPGDVSSDFPNPVPLTGDPNGRLLSITSASAGALYRADESALYQTSFTVEAMVRPESSFVYRNIVSQSGTGQEQWRLGFVSGLSAIVFSLSSDGATWVDFFAFPTDYTAGDDVYVAAAADVDSGSGTTVTLYYQNLTQSGSLLSFSDSSPSLTALFNSSASLSIGGTDTGVGISPWRGRVDEVRLSAGVLSSDELLMIPEPGTAALALLGLATVALRRRRSGRAA